MTDIVDTPDEECAICNKALAGVGLLIAGIFLYISIDVFTNGGLTRLFTKAVQE